MAITPTELAVALNHDEIEQQIHAEQDSDSGDWWFVSSNHWPLRWSKETIRKNAREVGSAQNIEIHQEGSIQIRFDRQPSITQLARFIELCIAHT